MKPNKPKRFPDLSEFRVKMCILGLHDRSKGSGRVGPIEVYMDGAKGFGALCVLRGEKARKYVFAGDSQVQARGAYLFARRRGGGTATGEVEAVDSQGKIVVQGDVATVKATGIARPFVLQFVGTIPGGLAQMFRKDKQKKV